MAQDSDGEECAIVDIQSGKVLMLVNAILCGVTVFFGGGGDWSINVALFACFHVHNQILISVTV